MTRATHVLAIFAVAVSAGLASAQTIVDTVADLTWAGGGGYQPLGMSGSVSGDTLTVDIQKNRSISGALGNTYDLANTGDYIKYTLSFQLSDVVTLTGGSLAFGFSNTSGESNLGQHVLLPTTAGNGQIGDFDPGVYRISSNLSTVDPGTTVHTASMLIEKTETGFTITGTSDLLASDLSVDEANSRRTPLATMAYDTFFIQANGNAVNQEELTMDVTNLLIETNLAAAATVLLGDANNDGVVSADDFAAVQTNFGNTGAADGLLPGDANDDGVVSADDFAAIQTNFGNVLGAATEAAPVPEPATMAMLGLVGLAAAFRGRGRRR